MKIPNVLVVDDAKTELLYLSIVLKRNGVPVSHEEGTE